MYDYQKTEKNDVINAIRDAYRTDELRAALADRDAFAERLRDELWIDDSVTGNGSGSYTFSRSDAFDYVTENIDLLREAADAFGCKEQIAEWFLDDEWESMDVTIRCYLLDDAIQAALEEIAAAVAAA